MGLNTVQVQNVEPEQYENWSEFVQTDISEKKKGSLISFSGVYNIKLKRNTELKLSTCKDSGEYIYPDIILETINGQKKIPEAVVTNWEDIEPVIDAYIYEYLSDTKIGFKKISLYGIYEKTVTDKFGNETKGVFLLRKGEDRTTLCTEFVTSPIKVRHHDNRIETFNGYERRNIKQYNKTIGIELPTRSRVGFSVDSRSNH